MERSISRNLRYYNNFSLNLRDFYYWIRQNLLDCFRHFIYQILEKGLVNFIKLFYFWGKCHYFIVEVYLDFFRTQEIFSWAWFPIEMIMYFHWMEVWSFCLFVNFERDGFCYNGYFFIRFQPLQIKFFLKFEFPLPQLFLFFFLKNFTNFKA